MSTIRLLDVSGIFRPLWHYHEGRGDPPGRAAEETVSALRRLAARDGADHTVACCDSGRSFRHAIGEEWKAVDSKYRGYKGHRPEKDPAMVATLRRVTEELEADGYPALAALGFEADDVIATVTAWAVGHGHDVEIVTDDKDLCALVLDPCETVVPRVPRVVMVRRDGTVLGPAEVRAKFGVGPELVSEYLAVVGDSSDHVPGVRGIGKETAPDILLAHGGYLKALEEARREDMALANDAVQETYQPLFTAAVRRRLIEGERAFRFSLRLTTLRADVPIDFAMVTAPRVPKPKTEHVTIDPALAAVFEQGNETMQTATEGDFSEPSNQNPAPLSTAAPDAAPANAQTAAPTVLEVTAPRPALAPAKSTALALPGQPTIEKPFELQLEPSTFPQAVKLAEHIAKSRKLKDMATADDVLLKMAMARSLGLNLYQAMCLFDIVEGKGAMAAQLVVARVRQQPACEYFRKKSGDRNQATWISKRKGDPHEASWTFTLEDAKLAKLGGIWDKDKKAYRDDFDPTSNWTKYRAQMLSWRAALFLAREEWTEVTAGIYDPDEIREQRDAPASDEAA